MNESHRRMVGRVVPVIRSVGKGEKKTGPSRNSVEARLLYGIIVQNGGKTYDTTIAALQSPL